ncbi:uncharacterized protein EI90DRAFT_1300736 [Cantharellus anzutake]|uniref:uncharacterized protein n=1 Tax=Cantharellus anzutake TaxID=1750568 RepID=UPI001908B80E|nr:uncharacterized protein EI90DRAFT_1300736 [Cantharellus anzutake]KAF8342059.1 hypothetical protein EI90DRAFT_1300736 [Cantharellus anzutake]
MGDSISSEGNSSDIVDESVCRWLEDSASAALTIMGQCPTAIQHRIAVYKVEIAQAGEAFQSLRGEVEERYQTLQLTISERDRLARVGWKSTLRSRKFSPPPDCACVCSNDCIGAPYSPEEMWDLFDQLDELHTAFQAWNFWITRKTHQLYCLRSLATDPRRR